MSNKIVGKATVIGGGNRVTVVGPYKITLGTMAVQNANGVNIAGGSIAGTNITFTNTAGQRLGVSGKTGKLHILTAGDCVGDKFLTVSLNNGDRVITFTGDASVEGVNRGDQDLTQMPGFLFSGHITTGPDSLDIDSTSGNIRTSGNLEVQGQSYLFGGLVIDGGALYGIDNSGNITGTAGHLSDDLQVGGSIVFNGVLRNGDDTFSLNGTSGDFTTPGNIKAADVTVGGTLTMGSGNVTVDAAGNCYWPNATIQLFSDVTIGNGSNKLAFFGVTGAVQQTYGATITNNVTAGGMNNTIANFTNLTTYATDATTIRNNIYQLARSQKIILDALRTYGLLS